VSECRVDPGRLRRALGLTVESCTPGTWRVRGGAGEHVVSRERTGWVCACADAAFHPGQQCKHRLAVYLHRRLKGGVRRALREAVGASS